MNRKNAGLPMLSFEQRQAIEQWALRRFGAAPAVTFPPKRHAYYEHRLSVRVRRTPWQLIGRLRRRPRRNSQG